MAEFRDRTYSGGGQVDVDGHRFVNCTFEAASLRYSGGEHPSFEQCNFVDVGWYFTDAALRTIQLLQAQNAVEGGEKMIAEIFKPGNYLSE
jgi:hypothetical protein